MSESPKEILTIFMNVAIPLASFVTGLTAAASDPLWLPKHPRLLIRSLLLILVVVPVATVLFLELVGAPPVVKAGLTIAVIAIGIGPPAAFQQAKAAKDAVAFEIGLDVILLALAMVYIPLFVAVHGAVFGHRLHLEVGQVAKIVLLKAMGPMLIGLLVGRLAPRVVKPFARYGGAFAMVVILAIVVFALVATWRRLLDLGGATWLICAAIVIGEILLGHAFGSADKGTRGLLVAFSSMRFPALALLLASAAPRGKEFIPAILAYVLTSVILVGIYSAVTSHRKTPSARPSLPVPPRGAAAAGPA